MHAAFFALRTPLLPFEIVAAWGDGLEAPAALGDPERLAAAIERDRAAVRARMRALVEQREVRDAIRVASPDLDAAIDGWLNAPAAQGADAVDRALVRYLTRMASRATPFGLFAATGVGETATATRLEVAQVSACRRRTRLDTEYLVLLAEALVQDSALSSTLVFRPNSSLHKLADRWRFVESRRRDKLRTHHLVAVDATPPLDATIARARNGATRGALVTALVDAGEASGEAEAFVQDVIDSQILEPDLGCAMTGPEPMESLRAGLAQHPAAQPVASCLQQIESDLRAIDKDGIGADPDRYRQVATRLASLPAPADPSRLFQVDLVRPAPGATLGDEVVAEIRKGVELLRCLAPTSERDALAAFRTAFIERYEQRSVPLLEALDEESGIGTALTSGGGADASPLLRDLDFPASPSSSVAWSRRETGLLRRVGEALLSGTGTLELSADDVKELRDEDPLPWPSALAAMATVIATDGPACARGDFRVLLHVVAGPSGASLLGRFCHADPELTGKVEEHLRAEEAAHSDAVFAEVVHLPEGRVGNILARPVLRTYEIPYLGRSGAPADRQIPMSDLTLSAQDGRLVLHSIRLGRRVIPRLTSAHNFARALGPYRLLCLLQLEGTFPGAAWTWGALSALPSLPRLTSGRLVLARATWRLTGADVKALDVKDPALRFRAVQDWRRARRLPRWIVLTDFDHTLPIDLDNVVAVDSFVHLLRGREEASLTELLPGRDELCAEGPEGCFMHELIVPFTQRIEAAATARPSPGEQASEHAPPATPARHAVRRACAPGSEWIYAKLYTGVATADRVLHHVVAPTSRELLAGGSIDHWFFIRYADPEPHLRWRLHAARANRERVRRAVEKAGASLIRDGVIRRIAVDTYDREVERYGGPRGIGVVERVFWADSEAVIDLLEWLGNREANDADAPGLLATVSTDRLWADLGLDAAERLAAATSLREAFGREFRVNAALRGQLATTYRRLRPSLRRLLEGSTEDGTFGAALDVLDRRSARLKPVARRLARLASQGQLSATMSGIADSVVHMHLNRLFRANHRMHELVVYDLLAQAGRQSQARMAKAGPANGPVAEPSASERGHSRIRSRA